MTIKQIIPAPQNLKYSFDGKTFEPVTCLALVERGNGETTIEAMGIVNCESIDVMEGAILAG